MKKKELLRKVFCCVLLLMFVISNFGHAIVYAESNSTSKRKYKFAIIDKTTGEFLKDGWMTINEKGLSIASFNSTEGFYEISLGNGTYEYVNKIAPTGYKLAESIKFTISDNKITSGSTQVTYKTYTHNITGNVISEKQYKTISDTEKQNYTLKTENVTAIVIESNLAKGDLKITKVDSEDNNKLLPNAKYRLWGTTLAGEKVEKEFITDENGEYVIKDFPLGTYQYQEINAPEGYDLDKTIYNVDFKANKSILTDASSGVTNKDSCETHNKNGDYYYYDYENGSYSTTKSSYEKKFDGSLYIGGNAKSSIQENAPPHTDLDDDPSDFTKILPYGNIFINVGKLNFNNASIEFPTNSPFHFIKNGDVEIGVDGNKISNDIYTGGIDSNGSIVYLGSLKSYIKGVGAPAAYDTPEFGQLTEEGYSALINNGNTATTEVEHNEDSVVGYGNTKVTYYKTGEHAGQNVITNDVDGYLYKIVFYDAAILPDGSIGDLILNFDEIIMEASTDKLENVPYVIQGLANQICSRINVQFNNGGNETMRWANYVYSPSSNNKSTTSANGTYKISNAIGISNEFSIQVVDKNGDSVDGSISYSLRDIDLATAENIWGRATGSIDYSEGMEIVSGSKSFAVMPKYNHVSMSGTIQDGYVFGHDMAINIEKNSTGNNADGLRFNAFTYTNIRDDFGKKIGGNTNNTNGITYIKDDQAYNSITGKRYALQRADNTTFDSGFAVLLDAKGAKLRWTGSSTVLGLSSVNTQIFDTSAFVRIQQSHGTGGDLYIEGYDYTNNCKDTPIRRDASMGIGDNTTLAIVPDDGWNIEKITIDGNTVMFKELSFDNNGVATYSFNGKTYTFTKDKTNTKKVRVSFDHVSEDHSISVDYIPYKEVTAKNKKSIDNPVINNKDIQEDKNDNSLRTDVVTTGLITEVKTYILLIIIILTASVGLYFIKRKVKLP